MSIEERLEQEKAKNIQANNQFVKWQEVAIKSQGAIEVLESLLADSKEEETLSE